MAYIVREWEDGVGGAKMQVYERERSEISADSERGGRREREVGRERKCELGESAAVIQNKDQNTTAKIIILRYRSGSRLSQPRLKRTCTSHTPSHLCRFEKGKSKNLLMQRY